VKSKDRWDYLKRSPKITSDLLLQRRCDFDFDLMPFHLRDLPLEKRLNLLKSGLSLIHRRLRPWSWPINMMIELTNHCNLRCPVCPTGIRYHSHRWSYGGNQFLVSCRSGLGICASRCAIPG
jgi:hypothetical protein